MEVKQGLRFPAAVRLMWNPSRRLPVILFSAVLITTFTTPSRTTSTTFVWPSASRFGTCSAG